MMGLDTTALIDLFKDSKGIKGVLANINEEAVLNHILYLELMFGLTFKNLEHKDEEKFYDALFNSYAVLNLDFNSSKKSSEILNDLKKSGKTIGLFDCTIAGIYLANGINKILTRNKKHFENIKGLTVISY